MRQCLLISQGHPQNETNTALQERGMAGKQVWWAPALMASGRSQVSRRNHSRPGCRISKLKLRELLCPCKCFTGPETRTIQSFYPQMPSQLQAFSPQTGLTMWPQPARCFLSVPSLFFAPCPLQASCLLLRLAVLHKETVSFMTCLK